MKAGPFWDFLCFGVDGGPGVKIISILKETKGELSYTEYWFGRKANHSVLTPDRCLEGARIRGRWEGMEGWRETDRMSYSF